MDTEKLNTVMEYYSKLPNISNLEIDSNTLNNITTDDLNNFQIKLEEERKKLEKEQMYNTSDEEKLDLQ
tara:strand:+ start:45 stop:251 length:207 start_codon:yes stop_codon:yes gene_type:complete